MCQRVTGNFVCILYILTICVLFMELLLREKNDSYVEQLQNLICEIKGSKEWVKVLKQWTQLALQSKSLEEFSDKIKV